MASLQALKPHASIKKPEGPVLVCVLDGWGVNREDEWNAVHVAETPTMDGLRERGDQYWRTVRAHGTAVGLPSDDDMGNSEVGHNALGAGKVIAQGAKLVDAALANGSVFTEAGWQYIKPCFEAGAVHFIGLLSDGGVHSRCNQLYGLMEGAARDGAKRIRVHVLTDGRDVPDGSGRRYISELEAECSRLAGKYGSDVCIASGGGRMGVTMDRYEADWNIVKKGWDAHVLGEAPHKFTSASAAYAELRGPEDQPVTDQWLPPFVITDDAGVPVGTVQDGDAVVVFNFRADRVVEISKAFEYEEFTPFDRVRFPKVKYVGLMQYDGDLKLPTNFLVPPPEINGVSGQHLAATGLSTFVCSETQKFGHVTFFWNGNRSGYFSESLETYVEIPSDKVPFNEKPAMKASEVCEAGKEALLSGKYDQVRVNFANPDMVGHTGDLKAAVYACALCDDKVKELIDACESMNGRWLITSDHGNSDDMVQRAKKTHQPLLSEEGKPLALTSHTLAPVPVAIGGARSDKIVLRDDLPAAGLANITATYINLMGFEAPEGYEPSLVKVL